MNGTDLPSLLPDLLPRLWAFALRLSGDRHDAEDLVQHTCLRALERQHQLKANTSPLSWMFAIAHSVWLNELRSRGIRGRTTVGWDDALLEVVADPNARTPETRLMYAQIIQAVAHLPETQRATLLLVAVEGLTYSEAAAALGVPIGTVMSRIARARRSIGALLDEPALHAVEPTPSRDVDNELI
ncbi:RNA polymerase sigma factor [Paraburkholderia rhizosphaerae]|uniref:RNA polymerase sigma-70 factor (ECF subfamily) n=1 Tax=Paraburkholderia rhizosphaerae TaxID=480658 RepID=A0A4R8LKD5_9BURK|nr:RNA polymerase sigma factor [Paraburkholderia rhizosphaerae]TDY42981.1 RNA polymerase sigma-70 factor (ECF subfamily) [Paraburkholderia rhizosphaerae]